MSTAVEVKLLTLLNVSAIKRPRDKDLPGGYRSSPSASRISSPAVTNHADESGTSSTLNGTYPAENGEQAGGNAARRESNDAESSEGRPVKKRKSVVWGGEVGPSGSTYGQGKKGKGKGKGKEKEVVEEAVNGGEQEEEGEDEELVGEDEDEEDEVIGECLVRDFRPEATTLMSKGATTL